MIIFVHGKLAKHRRLQTVALCKDRASAEEAAGNFLSANPRWSEARVWIDCVDVTERVRLDPKKDAT